MLDKIPFYNTVYLYDNFEVIKMPLLESPKLVRPPKLSEQIAKYLTSEINNGSLGEGEKLPSEASLCDQFNVSRTVVREAIGRLEYDGLIESRRGTRAVVANPHSRRVFRIDQPAVLDISDLRQLYEFRLIIEGSAVVLATKRCNRNDLRALKVCLQSMEDADNKGIDGVAANVRFHQLIAQASGNTYLRDFMMFLHDKITTMLTLDRDQIQSANIQRTIHKEHNAIYTAIKKKTAVKARKLLENHIIESARRQNVEIEPL